jgi:predicted transcriptional regulator
MKQLLIEIDAHTAARLERVAPARSRRRSEFIRMAIRRALWDLEERATQEAYARQPDTAGDAYFEPGAWEAEARPPAPSRRRR